MCTHAIVNEISKKNPRKSAHSFQLRIDSLNRKRDNDNAETPINSFRWFDFFCLYCHCMCLWFFSPIQE